MRRIVKLKKNGVLTTMVKGGTITLAAIESLTVPLVQEVVVLADFRCSRCQQRVAQIFSRMDGESQSVMISVVEKKVTLTCTYPAPNKPDSGLKFASTFRSSWTKFGLPFCGFFLLPATDDT